MLNRMIRFTLVSTFALAIGTFGVANAQADDDGANPCGAATDDTADSADTGGDADATADADGDADATPADEGAASETTAADGGGHHGLVVAKGKIVVGGSVGINVSTDAVAKPISINPDVTYGVAPKIDVGIYTSPTGITGFWNGIGGGLCISGADNGCAKAFNGPVAVLANYSLGEGKLSLAANGGLIIDAIDPMTMSLKAGIRGHYKLNDKMGIMFAPAIDIGLTERDFNKEILMIPVAFGYAVSSKLHAGIQTGLFAPLDGIGDFYMIPVNLGGMFALSEKLSLFGSLGFTNLLGKGSSADGRVINIGGVFHL